MPAGRFQGFDLDSDGKDVDFSTHGDFMPFDSEQPVR